MPAKGQGKTRGRVGWLIKREIKMWQGWTDYLGEEEQ